MKLARALDAAGRVAKTIFTKLTEIKDKMVRLVRALKRNIAEEAKGVTDKEIRMPRKLFGKFPQNGNHFIGKILTKNGIIQKMVNYGGLKIMVLLESPLKKCSNLEQELTDIVVLQEWTILGII